jgi:cell division protein FtsL
VDVSSERDALPRGTAGRPSPGSASRRYAPRSAVTLQVLISVLLVCLGVLLGNTWTTQFLQHRLQKLAEERRRLNKGWSMLRTACQQRSECPRCGNLLSARDCYYVPTTIEERPGER